MMSFGGNPVQNLGMLAVTALAVNALSNIPGAEAFTMKDATDKIFDFAFQGVETAIKTQAASIVCAPLVAHPVAYNACLGGVSAFIGQLQDDGSSKDTPKTPETQESSNHKSEL